MGNSTKRLLLETSGGDITLVREWNGPVEINIDVNMSEANNWTSDATMIPLTTSEALEFIEAIKYVLT